MRIVACILAFVGLFMIAETAHAKDFEKKRACKAYCQNGKCREWYSHTHGEKRWYCSSDMLVDGGQHDAKPGAVSAARKEDRSDTGVSRDRDDHKRRD